MLRQCLAPIMATILIGLLVLSAARFLIVFDLVLGNDQGLLIVARLLAAFVPHYLAFMLPLAVYLGSYMTARQLTVGSEVSILQATGSSIARSFASLIVLGVVFALINLAVVGWLQPLGRYSYRSLTYTLENSDFFLRVRESTFVNIGGRTVFVEKINPDRYSFEKILVYEPLPEGGQMTLAAPRGMIIRIGQKLNLRLYDGQRLLVKKGAAPDDVQIMEFGVLDTPVGNVTKPFRRRGDDELELLLPELVVQKQPLADASLTDLSMALHKRLVIALSCLFMPMLAVVLGTQSARKKNLYQTIFALLLIIIYHQLVEFAGNFGRQLAIGPGVLLWGVFAAFFITSAVLFYKLTTNVGTLWDSLTGRIYRWGTGVDLVSLPRRKPQLR